MTQSKSQYVHIHTCKTAYGEPDLSRPARRTLVHAATHPCYLWELEFPSGRRLSAPDVGAIRRPDALSRSTGALLAHGAL